MKWYRAEKVSEEYRDIIACYKTGTILTFYRRFRRPGERVDWDYWAYADEVDLQKDILDTLDNSTKTTLSQLTGKRLISI